jgi:hypothetical protein
MNPALGLLSFPQEENRFDKPYSEDTAKLIDGEVRSLVDRAYTRTIKVSAMSVMCVRLSNNFLCEVVTWKGLGPCLLCTLLLSVPSWLQSSKGGGDGGGVCGGVGWGGSWPSPTVLAMPCCAVVFVLLVDSAAAFWHTCRSATNRGQLRLQQLRCPCAHCAGWPCCACCVCCAHQSTLRCACRLCCTC